MAGQIPLFEIVDGLLRQVHPDKADAMRAKHRTKRVAPLVIDVILTQAELDQLEADGIAFKARREAQKKREAEMEAVNQRSLDQAIAAKAKLAKLGLTPAELEALFGTGSEKSE